MDKKTIERRTMPTLVEYRAGEGDDDAGVLAGMFAPFGKRSEDLFFFVEIIERGAFADVLDDDVRALFNHNPDNLVGRVKESRTLRLEERDDGAYYEVDLDETRVAQDVRAMVERRDLTGNSFAFIVDVDEFDRSDEDGPVVRTIKHIAELFDVGPVTYPAYPDTKVSARSMEQAQELLTGAERDAHADAAELVAKGARVSHAAILARLDRLEREVGRRL